MVEVQKLEDLSIPRPYRGGTFSDIGRHRHHQKDVDTLARLGKKQTLKV